MRPLRALGIYVVVVFLGGALLAPWLYWLVQAVVPASSGLAHQPFHRFVNRALLILALAGLWPLLRALGAASLRELGLARLAAHWRKLLGGFFLGFASLALVAVVTLAAGGRALNQHNDPMRLTKTILGAALTAVTVAVVEETLFRGGIFGGLRRVFHWSLALVVSSMVYSITHFIFLESARHGGAVTWTSGLDLLAHMMRSVAGWDQIVPGFFNLTLAGVLLALAYQRTGNLYFSIGLHAGWIFWLKSYRALTAGAPSANAWLWGTGKMIDGWLAFMILSLMLLAFTRLPVKRETHSVT